VVLLFLVGVLLYNYAANKMFITDFVVGTWMSKSQDILIMSFPGGMLEVSLGVHEGEEYNLVSKKYNYGITKYPTKQKYKISLHDSDMKIIVDVIPGTAAVYKKNVLLGVFVKTNMLSL
jgi:hypothetical protein